MPSPGRDDPSRHAGRSMCDPQMSAAHHPEGLKGAISPPLPYPIQHSALREHPGTRRSLHQMFGPLRWVTLAFFAPSRYPAFSDSSLHATSAPGGRTATWARSMQPVMLDGQAHQAALCQGLMGTCRRFQIPNTLTSATPQQRAFPPIARRPCRLEKVGAGLHAWRTMTSGMTSATRILISDTRRSWCSRVAW